MGACPMKAASLHPGVLTAARLLHLAPEVLQGHFAALADGRREGVHPSLLAEWDNYMAARRRAARGKEPKIAMVCAQRTICERIRLRHRIYVCPACAETHAAYPDGVMRPHVSGAPTGGVRRACPGGGQRAASVILHEGPRYAPRKRDTLSAEDAEALLAQGRTFQDKIATMLADMACGTKGDGR